MGIAHSRLGKFLTIFLSFLGLVMLGSTPAQGGGAGSLDPSFQSNANLFPVPAIRGKVNYGDGRSLLYGNFIIAANGKPYSNLVRLNADGSVDTNFDFPLREGTDVRAVCLLPGGQILVGGTFGLRRLNSDGSVDDTLSGTVTTPYGTVNALAMQTDGKILVGGCSLRVQGDTTNSYHLVRLRSDWTLDSVYPNRIGAGGNVNSIELLNDDPLNPDRVRIYGTLPGLSHNDFLLVLYSNGFEQWSIGSETVNGPIYAMVAQPNGKLVVAGQFTIAKGASYNGIVRLNSDLSLDNDFTIGTGFGGGQVSSLVLQDDGKIVAAGNFTSFNGAPCGYITRLQAGGSIDGTFSAGTGANDRIFRMEADGGNLNIYGYFWNFNQSYHRSIAVLSREGVPTSAYTTFSFGYWLLASTVYAQAVQTDGKILVGGSFTGAVSQYHEGVARFNPNGTLDSSFRASVDGVVKSIVLQPDGKILLGGLFWAVNGYACSTVARLNSDGSLDLGFKPFITQESGEVGLVSCVAWVSSGQIMIGGLFSYLNGTAITSLARLYNNGLRDFSFTPHYPADVGSFPMVLALADDVGRYVVAGAGPVGIGFLTRLTYSGILDPNFGSNASPAPNAILFDGAVRDVFIQGDEKIVVGGSFGKIQDLNIHRGHVARFTTNGVLDSGFTTTTGGANNDIYALGQQAGGKVLIGGNFTIYNEIPRNRIARLNPDGSLDFSFNPGSGANGPIWAILPLSGDKALIGGSFYTYYAPTPSRQCLVCIKTKGDCSVAAYLLLLD